MDVRRVMQASPSAALLLFWLLEECEKENLPAPNGTAHIRCDWLTCAWISERTLRVDGQPLDRRVVENAFLNSPVKTAFGVCKTALKIDDPMERDLMMRRYADKVSRRSSVRRAS